MPTSDARTLLPWFALAYGVFFVNDVGFILATEWPAYLAIDYGSRLLVLALLLGPRAPRALLLRPVPLRVGVLEAVASAAGCVVLWQVLEHGLAPLLQAWLGGAALAAIPSLPPPVKTIDLFAGMLLVAVSEELLARRAAAIVLGGWLHGPIALCLVATLLFAGMHWSFSPADLVAVFVIGTVLMAFYLRVGALWPLVLAHYAVDVVAFW